MRMSKRKIKGSIPVEPYLKKFALWIEKAQQTGIIELKGKGIVSIYLKMMMVFKNKLDTSPAINERCTEQLEFYINERHYDRGDYFLCTEAITAFNTMLRELFHYLLLQRIILGHQYGKKQQAIILEFLEEIGIVVEEDVRFDTLKKYQHRLREEHDLVIKFRNATPVLLSNPPVPILPISSSVETPE